MGFVELEHPDVTAAAALLARMLGERCSSNSSIRETHGRGEAFHADTMPDLVVFPKTAEEVSAVVNICRNHGVPIIPFGAGTSLEGNVAAPFGGVSMDFMHMDKIIAIHPEDLDCVVEPGVTREQLNDALRHEGLFFPIDPGANATIGGMCATRASGTNAVRYGTMRENVLWLEVVLADGSIVRTGRRARKSAAGYDLTRLFVGSEGTLGVITKIGMRLHGRPEATAVATCAFETLEGAVDTVVQTMQLGIPVARMELLDRLQVKAINAFSRTTLSEQPTLMFELHGSAEAVQEQSLVVQELASSNGGEGFNWATVTEEKNALWKARHDAYFAAQALRPGSQLVVTDVCVPISRLTECISDTHSDIESTGLTAPIVGHVGDGNFHVMISVDPEEPREIEAVRAFNSRLVDRALAMDGTCTGEHGIGLGKQDKLLDELGDRAVGAMRQIKRALDPDGLFNPGKIFTPNV